MNYNKYENWIRVGHTATQNEDGTYNCTDLEDFPTPSVLGVALRDLDKDPFTDLEGYTHRNRVRHDVLELALSYDILSDDDLSYILNRVSPVWIYVEVIDKKTKSRKIYKMYAGDKEYNTFKVFKDENGNWKEIESAFTISLVEE